jgi:predicted ATPase
MFRLQKQARSTRADLARLNQHTMSTRAPPYIGLDSLSIAGYRSFGAEPQRFAKFAKINIFIGQNNSGKSNVLRFIDERLQMHHDTKGGALSNADRHLPGPARLVQGLAMSPSTDVNVVADDVAARIGMSTTMQREKDFLKILLEKKKRTSNTDLVWCDMDRNGNPFPDDWSVAFAALNDSQLSTLWATVTGMRGGDRQNNWIPQLLQRLQVPIPSFESHMVPAIRKVGPKGSVSEGFGGDGIIDRLARLQNPAAAQQQDKSKFRAIRDFVRAVTSNPAAEIEIPHERDTIHVELDGKVMPIEALGTGIQEVIILAAAATVLDQKVVCMEEPELHLNPLLQKKLMRFLQDRTTNQYFIATHSAALMDTPDAEVYHLEMRGGNTNVERVTSDRHRSRICADLGYHPSDLLQSNCVVWVEGPSDRVYVEWWISNADPRLVEGIHYSVMFYGGRLASHLSADDDAAKEFILLRRLNRHGVIVMDSDKPSAGSDINETKKRLIHEFDKGPGHAFVTEGREIENYIEPDLLRAAIARAHPELTPPSNLGKFSNTLKLRNAEGKDSKSNKVRVANEVRASGPPNLNRFDLHAQIAKLVQFIVASNPAIDG